MEFMPPTYFGNGDRTIMLVDPSGSASHHRHRMPDLQFTPGIRIWYMQTQCRPSTANFSLNSGCMPSLMPVNSSMCFRFNPASGSE